MALAAPRTVAWQLGTRSGIGVGGVEAGRGSRQNLKFCRTESDLMHLRRQSYIAKAAYFETDALLVAQYWDAVLARYERPSSTSPPPSPSSVSSLSSPNTHAGMLGYTVKELQFESDCVKDWGVIPRLARVLSIGSTVTILKMEPSYQWDLLHLLPLMDALPALEELYVEPRLITEHKWHLAPKSHFFTQDQEDQMTGSTAGLAAGLAIPARQLMSLAEMRIRILVVFGVVLTLPAMEAVVRRIPRVEVLRFMQTATYSRELGVLGPTVTRTGGGEHGFVFSDIKGHRCPYRPSILGLSSLDIIPFQKYLTSFNCEWLTGLRFDRINTGTTRYLQNVIHKVLCSCPNLIIFTALGVYYYIEDMDVNNLLAAEGGEYRKKNDDPVVRSEWSACGSTVGPNLSPRPRSNPPPEGQELEPVWPRRVWACRNLRTLHISISGQRKSSGSHVFSLVLFGYLSRVCPRLEELSVKIDEIILDDESGLCLLGRLKFLERIQIHSLSALCYPDVAWLRRRKLETVGVVRLDGAVQDHQKQQQKQREPPPETLLERLVKGSRNQWVGGHPVMTPSAYLKKLPPLPAFQNERQPFWTVDGFDLSGVGRPDDLVSWLLNTNKDLITAPLDSQEQLDADQVQEDDNDDRKTRDEACLPRLELLYFYQSSIDGLTTTDAEQFMWTQRPEVDCIVRIVNYFSN
ncbi:hypothetical protein BGZ95_011532 [Linnemannia exigua]|uniref:Uncharacterized protein n=1 Tax=Linnemannia exigua TaxID=604196 RepID=A0AAD4DJU2_9FUNG|nr:hypothetical protein BGZ95_011532 [Linnemannia exigua]